jgi:hypothetical protein
LVPERSRRQKSPPVESSHDGWSVGRGRTAPVARRPHQIRWNTPISGVAVPRLTGHRLASQAGVDCRIQVTDEGDVRTVVIVGRLRAEHVPGLLSACRDAPHVRLRMADVLFVDAIAADALRRIRDAGAQFVNVPPYIQFKLDASPYRPHGA